MTGKKYKTVLEKLDTNKAYPLKKAIELIVDNACAKFDESVDVALSLNLSSKKKGDQTVRGFVVLPYGLGRKLRVLVFAKGSAEEEARKAGADIVGAEDLVEKIKNGWLEFDRAISTPDMMPFVSKIAKVLGPKGLMPNPKMGTVTPKVAQAVETEKKGKASFRADKHGTIHACVGRRSMGTQNITKNFLTFLQAVIKAKPSSNKGVYLKKIVLSSTMGPGVPADVNDSIAQL